MNVIKQPNHDNNMRIKMVLRHFSPNHQNLSKSFTKYLNDLNRPKS